MIQKDLIFTDVKAESRGDVIAQLAGKLLEAGKVKDTYREAVLTREEQYPTGLPLGDYCIAMPHTFAEHVNEPCIAVAKLRDPVVFCEMGDKDTQLNVSLVMMMAISDPDAQIGLLQKVLMAFSDRSVLEQLKESNSADEIYEILNFINE